ncbi:hypothetical protein K469DRAFT_809316, partial [Zopfia rhizophila CBS 207.26]
LSDIIGGPAFTMKCRIALDGVAINVSGLLDTGAGGTVFVHPRLHQVVKERLKPTFYRSRKSIPVAGHNNRQTGVVNQFFLAQLVIDERCTTTWFIFCDTGRHDLIIGRKWFELTKAMPDPLNQQIVWPDDAKIDAKRDIVIPYSAFTRPTIDLAHQKDADR